MQRTALSAWALVLCLSACSVHEDRSTADRIAAKALAGIQPFHMIKLDTVAIAAAVHDGKTVRLPFVNTKNQLKLKDVRLTLRNLRSPTLANAEVKNGVAKSFDLIRLPPPATYQGWAEGKDDEGVAQKGAAVFTLNERVVEGNILIASSKSGEHIVADGWSIIEPLEPQLRLRGVDAQQREIVLRYYNHIVYNVRGQHQRVVADADLFHASMLVKQEPVEPAPLVVSSVADGDSAFYHAYPPDSVMPFWLKEEALFNVLDWLFNCIEPEANPDNAYTRCDNEFDGGANGFRAQVRLDRLEAWEQGGPSSANRVELLRQSARETHQATPPCCGEPHTAGRSALVFFFSGRTLEGGAGYASVAGLAVYDDSCFTKNPEDYLCHHALTQVTPGGEFPGNAFFQELLVAHEVGHIIGGEDQTFAFGVSWLFGQQSGPNLMGSLGLNNDTIYHYTEMDARDVMGPLLRKRLGSPLGKQAERP